MSSEANKLIVRRFFEECLDGGSVETARELFAEDCVIHRPEAGEPLRGHAAIEKIVRAAAERYHEMHTTLELLIGEGDFVACRLSHRVVFKGEWVTRLGVHDVAGKELSWNANVFFRLKDARIVEEWVVRDELGMHLRLGVLEA